MDSDSVLYGLVDSEPALCRTIIGIPACGRSRVVSAIPCLGSLGRQRDDERGGGGSDERSDHDDDGEHAPPRPRSRRRAAGRRRQHTHTSGTVIVANKRRQSPRDATSATTEATTRVHRGRRTPRGSVAPEISLTPPAPPTGRTPPGPQARGDKVGWHRGPYALPCSRPPRRAVYANILRREDRKTTPEGRKRTDLGGERHHAARRDVARPRGGGGREVGDVAGAEHDLTPKRRHARSGVVAPPMTAGARDRTRRGPIQIEARGAARGRRESQ